MTDWYSRAREADGRTDDEVMAEIQTPPWPAHWKCNGAGCGHRRSDHAEPIVRNGVCLVRGCECEGWDPLTADQWRAVFDAHREGRL